MKNLLSALCLVSAPALASELATETPPDVHMQDVNPRSPYAGLEVDAHTARGMVSMWYFLGPDDILQEQIPALHELDVELDDDAIAVSVFLVVPPSLSDKVASFGRGHALPVLFDVDDAARTAWNAQPGDLIVVDRDSRVRNRVTLAATDLRNPWEKDALESEIETFVYDLPMASLDVRPATSR
ncbi:MAG: hypothetical protein H6733_10595 [Alphaproteobacteria bacterium]|nr:hypothetical protein [Alphaproteobacteria bacterium]